MAWKGLKMLNIEQRANRPELHKWVIINGIVGILKTVSQQNKNKMLLIITEIFQRLYKYII